VRPLLCFDTVPGQRLEHLLEGVGGDVLGPQCGEQLADVIGVTCGVGSGALCARVFAPSRSPS
jgi:hypothetical protein